MLQHLMLMLVVAPVLVWVRPPRRMICPPAAAWALFCGVILVWHIPAVYRWTMGGGLRQVLMQFCFLGAALAFWSVVLVPERRRQLGPPGMALYVLAAALVTGLPGALIAFARHPLYVAAPLCATPAYVRVLADQQLAGLIMWIPMDLVLFSVALALFGAALRAPDAGQGRRLSERRTVR